MTARSMNASEVCTLSSSSLRGDGFGESQAKVRSTIQGEARNLKGALPAFGNSQLPPMLRFESAGQLYGPRSRRPSEEGNRRCCKFLTLSRKTLAFGPLKPIRQR